MIATLRTPLPHAAAGCRVPNKHGPIRGGPCLRVGPLLLNPVAPEGESPAPNLWIGGG